MIGVILYSPPRRSVHFPLFVRCCSRRTCLTVILHLRHGARIVFRVTTPPGRDSCSYGSRLPHLLSVLGHPEATLNTCAVCFRGERPPGAVCFHYVNVLCSASSQHLRGCYRLSGAAKGANLNLNLKPTNLAAPDILRIFSR